MESAINVVMLGLDSAGKTTLLYCFLNDKDLSTSAKEIDTQSFSYKREKIMFFDVNGGAKLRPLWKDYTEDMNAVLFVVDSADEKRIGEAACAFSELVTNFPKLPLLILCNKCDIEGALSIAKITDALKLNTLTEIKWLIMKSSGKTGKNREIVLDWIISRQEDEHNKLEETKDITCGKAEKKEVEDKEDIKIIKPKKEHMLKQCIAITQVLEHHKKLLMELDKIFQAPGTEKVIVAEDGTVTTQLF
eukprot:TRINITY_DN961_c0_g1_i9.p1 TRINITY_DN961_c0_g1~~TRINITY_DN961_c0_g1_i9.p1  ORF type:complete len:284 (+),score=56.66 TRINITY_DN961_c0_g1_i9:112-852(+)